MYSLADFDLESISSQKLGEILVDAKNITPPVGPLWTTTCLLRLF